MKVIVEIDLTNHTIADYEAHKVEWHNQRDKALISIDKDYLVDDPKDESFFVVRLVRVDG